MWLRKKERKKLKSLVRFYSANKINNYNKGGGGRKKVSKRIYRTSQNIGKINVFLSHCCQSPFPRWESQSTSPLYDALYHCADLWTCCEGSSALTCSSVFLPPMSTAIRTSGFSFVGALSGLLYIPQTQSLPSWSCGFNWQLVKLMGGFRIFFLSHIAPGFQLWLYFYLWMWFVHRGLLLRLPLRTCVGPCEGQVWRWCSCLSHRGSGNTRCSGGLAARAAGNIVSRRVWKPVFANMLLPGETPSLTERPGRRWSTGSQRVRHYPSDPARRGARLFLPVAAPPQWELSMKVAQLLGLRGPWKPECAGTRTASAIGVMALSESFLQPLVAGDQKASVASLSLSLCPFRHLRGLPCPGSFSVARRIRHTEGPLAWGPTL